MPNSKLLTLNFELVALVVAFVALAGLYSVVTPLGEGPDEPGHAAYVFFLAREGRLPVQRAAPERPDVPGEGHQPPLAYTLAAPLAAWLPPSQRQIELPPNPRSTWAGGSELNAVAHGSREFWPWQGAVLAWHLARLVSVALGAVTVVFTYLAGKAVVRRLQIGDGEEAQSTIYNLQSAIPWFAAALVAFSPQFLFTSALVTNDALLAALSAALLWLVVRGAWRTWAHALAMGVVLGLALITKQSALLLAPVALGSVIEQSWRAGTKGRGRARTSADDFRDLRRRLATGDWRLATAVLGRGRAWTSAENVRDLRRRPPIAVLGRGRTRTNADDERVGGKHVILSSCHRVILSHALLFAAATLAISGWWYARNLRLYGDLFGLAAFRAEFATQPFEPGRIDAWIGALAQLHASFWARFGWMNVPPPAWVVWFFALIEAVAIVGFIRRRARGAGRGAIGIRRGARGEGREARGDRYQARGAGREARGEHGGWLSSIVGRLSSVVGHWSLAALPLLALGWVASFALTAGLVAWQGRLLFPALPAIAIVLAVGMQNVRLKMQKDFSRTANFAFYLLHFALLALAFWLPFGVIRPAYPFHTLPEGVATARIGNRVYGRFVRPRDSGAEVLGWRAGDARPGGSLDLTLMWHARGRMGRDWAVFIHLVDAGDNIVAEENRLPQHSPFPTGQWVIGDWLEERHTLALPPGLAPGAYTLRVGLFDPVSGARAGVFNEKRRLIGDYLDLGQVTVAAPAR